MSHTRTRLHGLFLLSVVLAASCDSGVPSAGIDGTGSAKGRAIISLGRVLGTGAIQVNGVLYDTRSAKITIDGSSGSQTDLNEGDIVLVQGTLDSGDLSAEAQQVNTDHVLQGTVESIDTAGGSLVALGQTVQINDDTAFGASLAGGLPGLSNGDQIKVSGFRNLRGVIEATRIDRQAAGVSVLKTTGAITSVAPDGSHLSINGLVVDYSDVQGLTANVRSGFVRGAFVEVHGSVPAAGGPLVADGIELKVNRLAADRIAHIQGYFTTPDSATSGNFAVDGLAVSTTSTTTFTGAVTDSVPITVKGAADAGGVVVASSITAPLSLPITPTFTLRGRVFNATTGPIAGASVFVWVQTATFGYSSGLSGGSIKSGLDGGFSYQAPVGATLLVQANAPGYVQPCAVWLDANNAGTSHDVELVATSTLDSFNPPLPNSAAGATSVSGTAYETTPAGRQPIAGAMVWLVDNSIGDLVYAETFTDRNGHYFACNLPHPASLPPSALLSGAALVLRATGFQDADIYAIDTSQSIVLDVEMKRN
jgi:Domain of unknown function (DUF5666)